MPFFRCTYHSATFDYQEKRVGDRVVSLGEAPYFDPQSGSRRDALGLDVLDEGDSPPDN
jgi:hypothetical protein